MMVETIENPRGDQRPTDPSTRWSVDGNCDLRWRTWGDECIVYHCQSGDTHLLNTIAAEALKLLQQSPASADELTKLVASSLDLEANKALLQHMEKLLATFDELGLIGPVNEA